jgi:hypothetical protein
VDHGHVISAQLVTSRALRACVSNWVSCATVAAVRMLAGGRRVQGTGCVGVAKTPLTARSAEERNEVAHAADGKSVMPKLPSRSGR